jgi:hypothetical protein
VERPEERDHLLRITPLTYVLVVALALVLALYFWPARDAARTAAHEQAAIEETVKKNNDFAASIQKIKDDTKALLDPLVQLRELDRRLEATGLPPQSAKDFAADLAEANQKLIASGATEYIDTCEQKAEVEKHLLYQGLHGPVQALPGWTPDWQTRCLSILPSSPPSSPAASPGG